MVRRVFLIFFFVDPVIKTSLRVISFLILLQAQNMKDQGFPNSGCISRLQLSLLLVLGHSHGEVIGQEKAAANSKHVKATLQ